MSSLSTPFILLDALVVFGKFLLVLVVEAPFVGGIGPLLSITLLRTSCSSGTRLVLRVAGGL